MKNRVGARFGRLLVIAVVDKEKREKTWLCKCDCGNTKIVQGNHLQSGATKSCGCLRKEVVSVNNTIHGMSRTRIHNLWYSMIQRCTNPNTEQYKNYGGRGIKVCERWYKFENFYKDMGDPPKNYTLDRIDNNGNYEPNNCEWADSFTQANNRRNNKMITFNGRTQTLVQWTRELNLDYKKVSAQIINGVDINVLFGS